ncbi:Hypothetical predicted protein, partial [Lynx pardinus]
KEGIMKAAKEEKSLTYKGRQIRFAAYLPTETWQVRKEWQDTLNMLNGKNMQPRILYPARLSFRIKGEIKSFPNKQNLKERMKTDHFLTPHKNKLKMDEILKGKTIKNPRRDSRQQPL